MLSGTVWIKESIINVEITTTPKEMALGLMNRTNLPENNGMLFMFNGENHKFWMKNTLIPLDMVWIDKNGKIIHIEKNTMPCNTPVCPMYGPESNSSFVLELNGRYTERHGINVGDRAIINVNGLFIT